MSLLFYCPLLCSFRALVAGNKYHSCRDHSFPFLHVSRSELYHTDLLKNSSPSDSDLSVQFVLYPLLIGPGNICLFHAAQVWTERSSPIGRQHVIRCQTVTRETKSWVSHQQWNNPVTWRTGPLSPSGSNRSPFRRRHWPCFRFPHRHRCYVSPVYEGLNATAATVPIWADLFPRPSPLPPPLLALRERCSASWVCGPEAPQLLERLRQKHWAVLSKTETEHGHGNETVNCYLCLHLHPPPHTCVRAEHSTYLTALSFRASLSPLLEVRARCLFSASFSSVLLSSLRSTWVPTSRNGVRGQWCEISGTHCGQTSFYCMFSEHPGSSPLCCCPGRFVDMWDTETSSQTHLLSDILKGGGGYDREADEEDVGLGVAAGSQSVVVHLTCRGTHVSSHYQRTEQQSVCERKEADSSTVSGDGTPWNLHTFPPDINKHRSSKLMVFLITGWSTFGSSCSCGLHVHSLHPLIQWRIPSFSLRSDHISWPLSIMCPNEDRVYLQCQTAPERTAPRRSSLLTYSYQAPGRERERRDGRMNDTIHLMFDNNKWA